MSVNKELEEGLAIDLHFDRVIRLFCAADSRGWSIEAAQPPNDGDTLRSGRVDYVEYRG